MGLLYGMAQKPISVKVDQALYDTLMGEVKDGGYGSLNAYLKHLLEHRHTAQSGIPKPTPAPSPVPAPVPVVDTSAEVAKLKALLQDAAAWALSVFRALRFTSVSVPKFPAHITEYLKNGN
jgi:hypothetical protein